MYYVIHNLMAADGSAPSHRQARAAERAIRARSIAEAAQIFARRISRRAIPRRLADVDEARYCTYISTAGLRVLHGTTWLVVPCRSRRVEAVLEGLAGVVYAGYRITEPGRH